MSSCDQLMSLVIERDLLADLDPAARRLALRDLVTETIPPGVNPAPLVGELADLIDGFGPLSSLMADVTVTDVLVNAADEVWVQRAGAALELTECRFRSPSELRDLAQRWVTEAGGRLDASEPLADVVLRDGSRLHAVLPPISPSGPLLSIRRFPRRRFSLSDLAHAGMFDDGVGERLQQLVQERATIVISGATGTGKTTLLNALIGCVTDERVVVIEETPELQPSCPHVVRLCARRANAEGRGEITLDSLSRNALRMRPDRIIVGEARGSEASVALTAMATGHEGSMLTIHARSADSVIDRLVTLSLQAGSGASESSLQEAARSAVDLVVHLEARGGRRRVAQLLSLR